MKLEYKIFLRLQRTSCRIGAPIRIRAQITTKKGKLVVKYYPKSKKVYKDNKIVNLIDFVEQGYITMTYDDFAITRGMFGSFMWEPFARGEIYAIGFEPI